jgi:hypothetical protein
MRRRRPEVGASIGPHVNEMKLRGPYGRPANGTESRHLIGVALVAGDERICSTVPAGASDGASARDKSRSDEDAAARKGRVRSSAEHVQDDQQDARRSGDGDSVSVHAL